MLVLTAILLFLQAGISHIFAGKHTVKHLAEPGPTIGSAEMMAPCYLAKHLFKQILDTYNE